MSWVCPVHGKEKIHRMILNEDVNPFEFEVFLFSCGRFVIGTIKGKTHRNPGEFLTAFQQLLDEWKQTKELYHHFGFEELESYIDRKLGIEQR